MGSKKGLNLLDFRLLSHCHASLNIGKKDLFIHSQNVYMSYSKPDKGTKV